MRRVGLIAVVLAIMPACAALSAEQTLCAPVPVRDGCGTFTWSDGSRYVGNFHGGYFDGRGTVTFSDGSTLGGEFRGGSPFADLTYALKDGTKFTGAFHDAGKDIDHPHKPVSYPFWRALFGDQSDVQIAVVIGEDGSVFHADPYIAIESPSYRAAAIEGVSEWRYTPATVDGHPVKTVGIVELQFSQPR